MIQASKLFHIPKCLERQVSIFPSPMRLEILGPQVGVLVKEINDPPVIESLPGIQFAEIGVIKSITLEIEDPDTPLSSLSTTNKSWADIDNTGTLLTILPPVAGFNSILVKLGEESCDSIVIELEIKPPDLVVEDLLSNLKALNQEMY